MQLAWQRENSPNTVSVKQSITNRLVYIAYNIIYFVPIVLPFTKVIDYSTGFIMLFIVLIIRAIVNIYRNNVLNLEQAESLPFRSP
jgi:hypothetical protein